jgi:hypothetical protein
MCLGFTVLLPRPLFLQRKLCLRDFRRVKISASNLRRALIFSSEESEKVRLKFAVMRHVLSYFPQFLLLYLVNKENVINDQRIIHNSVLLHSTK